MPGIAAIISSTRNPEECRRLVGDMVGVMLHETFYQSGTEFFLEQGIYGGWVAHAGSFAAGQTFWSRDKGIALLFAGECYFKAAGPGDSSASSPDAQSNGERLIQLYLAKGRECFEQLNGIFSGLLIDKRQGRAFLFNDRYGIERLYYHKTGDAMFVASEAKALLKVLPDVRAFDDEGVAEFLSFGCVLEGRTLFRGVRTAPGGSLWTIQDATIRKEQYFTPAQWESQPTLSEGEFESMFAQTFQRILPGYFESGSRLGISLTGGLDTRMIMASLPDCQERPVTYTFGGPVEAGETLDEQLARRVAQVCGLEHRVLRLGPKFFAEFGSYVDRTVYNTDGCCSALVAHEIFFHEQARECAAVRLTGNYGSEILRSMSTFKPLGMTPDLMHPEFATRVNECGARFANRQGHPVTFAAFKEIPWNLFGTLAAGRSQITFRTPYLDNEVVALAFKAPMSARTSPEPAVRYVRRASAALGAIPTDRGQAGAGGNLAGALRRLYASVSFKLDYMCSEGLPFGLSAFDSIYRSCNRTLGILGQHKFLQYRRWLQNELFSLAEDRVTAARLPFFGPQFLTSMVREHKAGRKNYTREINAVLTLEAVERMMFRGGSAENS